MINYAYSFQADQSPIMSSECPTISITSSEASALIGTPIPAPRCPLMRRFEKAVLLHEWNEVFDLIKEGADPHHLDGWALRVAIAQKRPEVVRKMLTLCGDRYLIHAPTVSLARKIGHPIILAMMEG